MMRITLLFLSTLLYASLFSQQTSQVSLFDKLYDLQNVKITLTYPFDSLYKSNNNLINATISIASDQGTLISNEQMTMSLRGKFRRMKCTFPPILLHFRKSMLKDMNLSNADEIKLVTHCLEGPEGKANLQEERLMYQVYESVTPMSYRTIWLNIYYCNLENPGVCDTSVAFLLEPDKVIGKRLGLEEKKLFNLTEDSLQYDSYANTAAFNFMIGNKDWSVSGSRNAKLFFNPTLQKYVVIPYDFDYSNVVGASYRNVSKTDKLSEPYDRIYQGDYFSDKSGIILKSFYKHKSDIINTVIKAQNPMGDDRRKQICKYFESWFDMINKHNADELNYGILLPYKGGL